MATLFPKTISYQTATGGYSETTGKWEESALEDLTFQGNVQPMTGKEIQSSGIARLDKGAVKIYSNTRLPVSEEGGDAAGAIVQYAGKKWEVVAELPYLNSLIEHYKYIAAYRGEI